MKTKLKPMLKWTPEIILILATIYYWLDSGKLLNPFAIGFMVFLVAHIILNKRIIGIILSAIFGLMTLYLFLAWYSDVIKFKVYDQAAKEFIFFGLAYLGVMMIMSFWIMGRSVLGEHKTQPVIKEVLTDLF